VSLGICTDAPPQNIRLLPGACPSLHGGEPEGADAPAPAVDDAFRQISDAWQILDGPEYGVGRDCQFQPMEALASEQGLELSIEQNPLAGPAQSCGAVRSEDSYALGTLTASLVAARGSGLVTELSLTRGDERGLQGVAFYVAGTGRRVWAVSFADGAHTDVRVDLAFDPTEGEHKYTIAHRDAEIVWIIDGAAVARQPRAPGARVGGRITLGAWSALDAVWAGPQPEARPAAAARVSGVTLVQ
jgi:hypothetical protein